MDEELELVLMEAQEAMENSVTHFVESLQKIRAGKANPQMLHGLLVEAYGATSPLNAVANVSASDSRTLTIQPFDKGVIADIEKAIINSNLGFNPMNDGGLIRINIPPLTGERRGQLVKMAKQELENAKVGVRNARRDANDSIKKMVKDGLSEDMGKDAEASIQKDTDKTMARLDELCAQKEADITTV